MSIPYNEIARSKGWTPRGWFGLTEPQQIAVLRAPSTPQRARSLGANSWTDNGFVTVGDMVPGAAVISDGVTAEPLYLSDFTENAPMAWWTVADGTGPGPWPIRSATVNGLAFLWEVQRLLAEGLKTTWKNHFTGQDQYLPPAVNGRFDADMCAALYAYAGAVMPNSDWVFALLADLDATVKNPPITASAGVLNLCILLTYYTQIRTFNSGWPSYGPPRIAALSGKLGFPNGSPGCPHSELYRYTQVGVPANTVRGWAWGMTYPDPSPSVVPHVMPTMRDSGFAISPRGDVVSLKAPNVPLCWGWWEKTGSSKGGGELSPEEQARANELLVVERNVPMPLVIGAALAAAWWALS